jgi:hypothetical protein
MDLFELKRIADKLITNFPWHKDHGGIGVQIQANSLRVVGTGDAITVIMHSDILTEREKDMLVYEVDDDIIDIPETFE